MNPLIINRKDKALLKVLFDKDKNIFIINGNSLPENAVLFFTPIHDWLAEYAKQPNNKSVLHLYLNCYNTTSSKHLLRIFLYFKSMMEKEKAVLVKWYGAEEADYIEEAEVYQSLAKIPFEFVEEVPDFLSYFN